MDRFLRLALAGLLAVLALLTLGVALNGTTVHYLLPSPTGQPTSRRAVFAPGVVAAVVASAVAVVGLVWVVVNLVSRPRRGTWFLVGACVAVDLVVVVVVSGLQRPAF